MFNGTAEASCGNIEPSCSANKKDTQEKANPLIISLSPFVVMKEPDDCFEAS